jgi:MFS family permease
MSDQARKADFTGKPRRQLHYGWVIVLVSLLMMAITYGLMYSYSVFFKPLALHFNWNRETTSAVYSASLIIRGAVSIGIGWLADKYGANKVMAFCGFMIGLGLILSSQITALWQFFLTFALVEAIGLSGTFGIATAVTSRWFTKNRGLALGIVSSGTGLGTLVFVPGLEMLIQTFDWSRAFLISGIICGAVMFSIAFLLRSPPASIAPLADSVPSPATADGMSAQAQVKNVSIRMALRNPQMLLVLIVYALFFFCAQTVTVHLVNYATDLGIDPLVAATLISIIGVVSIAGRLSMGLGSDRINLNNMLILSCALLTVSLITLIFIRSLWAFYVFAAVFGFAYGGEVPQIPMFIGRLFGTKTLATLLGLTLFVTNIGGALGPWVTGLIFDITSSYQKAFWVLAAAGLCATGLAVVLKRYSRASPPWLKARG